MPVYIIFLDDDDHMTAWRPLGGSGGPGSPHGPGSTGGSGGPESPNLPDSIYEKCRIRTVYSV